MITKSQQPLICDAATFRDYGRSFGNTKLAEIVLFLYKSTRASSTHKSYSVEQCHWARFQRSHRNIPLFPLESSPAKPITRTLGLSPRTGIPPASGAIPQREATYAMLGTVAGRRPHGRASTPPLRSLMRAIKRALPSPPDPREPPSCPSGNTLGTTSFSHPIDC